MEAVLSNEEAKRFLKSKRHFLSTPNVVSLGFINGKWDDQKRRRGRIFRVGVIKKLSQDDIKDPDIFIPKFLEHTVTGSDKIVDIRVKIFEEGELVATIENGVKLESQGGEPQVAAPCKGGSVIRNADLDFEGCLGANAQYKGVHRLLSAAHVLTKFDSNYIGRQILMWDGSQWVDIDATVTGHADVVLYDSSRVSDPVRAKQDLAWANIPLDRGSGAIIQIGTPGGIREVIEDEKVKYYAGKAQMEQTNVSVGEIYAEMRLRVQTPSKETKYAYFEDVCRIDDPIFADSGDSGTAIVAVADNALLGILFCKSNFGTSYFCKLQP